MKILLTADPFLPVPPKLYGGIERIIDGLCREYRNQKHEIGLVAHADSTTPTDFFSPWPEGCPASILKGALHLRTAVRKFEPDLLHSFSRLAYLAGSAITPLPKIMSYQRATGGANITVWHHLIRNLSFTGCSEYICSLGRRAGGDWFAIPNFVDVDQFSIVPSVPEDAPLVFLSRLESIKGAHRAIEIARRSGRRLILAGNRVESTEGNAYWNQQIQPHLEDPLIDYVGPVDDRQKNDLLGKAAALLVPIEWDEPFGIVFAEALACGTPVISAPRGALPEIVHPGVHGFLINDIEEGVRAVANLPNLSRQACRKRVEEAYSLEKVSRQYLEYYSHRAQI